MSWALAAGDVLAHYRVLSPLGSGGMAQVYLAEDVRLGRRLALKELSPRAIEDESRMRRFEREARTISALNHPNILTVYDVGQAVADVVEIGVAAAVGERQDRQRIDRPPPAAASRPAGCRRRGGVGARGGRRRGWRRLSTPAGVYFFLPVKVPSPNSPSTTFPFIVPSSTVPE